ncbi:MAG: hypothetical protein H7Z43_14375 [Clostridia bacterium]|nr:hypothetical protein [Deltaproteobacteria bacterium]
MAKLAPVITDANAERLLHEVRGKTVRDVERMVVREAAKPAVQSGFRSVFAPAPVPTASSVRPCVQSNAGSSAAALSWLAVDTLRTDTAAGPPSLPPISRINAAPPTTKLAIEPRAVDHYAFRANMNEATHITLREAMDVGNFENYDALFAAAVEALRTKMMKKKLVKCP